MIYVDGWAQFDQLSIDSATFIVNGQLTLAGASGGASMGLHVPRTAALEYPYNSGLEPCAGQEGALTGSSPPYAYGCSHTNVFSGNVQFRGFLYVKGNLLVKTANWNMVGALMVGDVQSVPGTSGQIYFNSGSLNIAYDDVINHNIWVKPVSGTIINVQPDMIQEVPAS